MEVKQSLNPSWSTFRL